jgi:23S rRNA (uracil1939-C5)-methyltransferase
LGPAATPGLFFSVECEAVLLTIEKMIYGGDGLARLPADAEPERSSSRAQGRLGKAVFVPFVLPGEQVEASVVEERPGFIRARAEHFVSTSPLRTPAPCPYYKRCGGCHYQHTGYEQQLEIKSAILRENLRRLARIEWQQPIEVHASPPWNYRNRTRLQVRTRPEFTLAYYRFSSHELLSVEQCPISSPLINRAIAAVWEAGRAGALPAEAREIEFFADGMDETVLVELSVLKHPERGEGALLPQPKSSGQVGLPRCARDVKNKLHARLAELAGVSLFGADAPGRELHLLDSAGEGSLDYAAAGERYRVSAASFFQTNRHLTDELVQIVTADRRGALALDLYAGVGLFSLPLARSFEHVVAVEAAPSSSGDLRRNAPPNVQPVRATTQQFLEQKPQKQRTRERPDYVVVDPPRAGLGPAVVRGLARLGTPRLTYVSCDPATLSRDLKMLVESGLRVERVHLVDLFPQTFHVETVVELVR